MVGQAAASPRIALSKAFSSRSLSFHTTYKARRSAELWSCERCLHSNRRPSDLKKTLVHSPTSRLQPFQQTRLIEAVFFTSQKRSQSSETDNGPDRPRKDLPSEEEGRRSQTSKRFNHLMDNLQSNIFIAGQRLNDLTGYSGIEALKKDIERQGPCPCAYYLLDTNIG